MKKNKFIRTFIIIVIAFIFIISANVKLSAKYTGGENGTNYETLTEGQNGLISTQEAYVVNKVMNKFTIKGTTDTYTLGTPTESYYDNKGKYL